jgi:hypothetical protein
VTPSPGDGQVRFRRTSLALVAAASILLFFGAFAVWLDRQALHTDDWVETSGELLEDPDIQDAVATFLVDELFSAVDVDAQVRGFLPEPAQGLAGPAAGGLRELADRAAHNAIANPRVQELWKQANRAAHEGLLAVVEGEEGALSAGDGAVTLDLESLVGQIGARVGIDLSGELPAQLGEIVILRSDEIEATQDGARLLEALAVGLVLGSLALYGLAVGLARGRRRQTIRALGYSWIVVGIAVLAARGISGGAVVDHFASTVGVEPAVESTWSIGTSLLAASAAALIGYGLVAVLGAWLAGPRPLPRAARRAVAPLFHSRPAAYGVLLAIVVVIFWTAPTEGTERLAPSIVLLVLLAAGFEALRRQTLRDFPEETWERAGPRWRTRFAGLGERLRSRGPERVTADEQRLRQLERLERLQASGVLTPDELEREKARLLG